MLSERELKVKAKRGSDTRWMYFKEANDMRCNKEAYRSLPMDELRAIAWKIWKKEAPKGRKFPNIAAARGVVYCGALCSYCMGYTTIKLARHHRNPLVLIHELTHALGPTYHGKYFVRRYFPLLKKYAGFDGTFLEALAAERGYAVSLM